MQVCVIVNPISGRRGASHMIENVRDALCRQDCEVKIVTTREPGDAIRFAAEVPEGTRAVIVAGGDGTVREVVDGLNGRRVPLVILPTGTENLVAKYFGYRADAHAVIDTVLRGRVSACDVGVCGSRKFVLLVGVGFDAQVVRRVVQSRGGHISRWTYIRPAWQAFRGYHSPRLSVSIEGQTVFEGQAMVWVGILPRYALGVRILARAEIDDGLLDVCIMPCRSRRQLVAHAVRLPIGRHLKNKTVQYYQCKDVRIAAANDDPIPVQVDGDYAGTLPIDCRVIATGVHFLRPGTKRPS